MPTTRASSYRVLSGICPDEKCQAKLFFPSYDRSIECTACGQRHEQYALRELQEVTNPNVALHNMIRNVLVGNTTPKKGAEMVKVRGLSNYHCKLLSPLLSYYGMEGGKAKLLRDMKKGNTFDCSVLGNRAFLIEPEHVDIIGYGRDISGSQTYLSDTLKMIAAYNDGHETLLPIHADGDGHCLVHAVSRALVGRELFWHPLRLNLKNHFQQWVEQYKEMFKDFIDPSEWQLIIDECDPDFQPPDGELLGLRNIHVFGLANVLRRPIILLDSLSGMQSSGDYSALFLPGLVEAKDCRKGGELNKPLCLAWSSSGRNHYIALVGIKNGPLPRLHRSLLPKPWGVSEHLIDRYLEFLPDSECCIIGGDNCLKDEYIARLAEAMEEIFMKEYKVHPAVIADVHHYVYKRTGVIGALSKEVLQATQRALEESRLYRCLTCDAVCEQNIISEWFQRGGILYALAEQKHGKLKSDNLYSFPMQGVTCNYDAERDELVPDMKKSIMEKCSLCHGGNMRLINRDGSIQYRNGDRTKTTTKSNYCNCGFKHYWDGKEYDNLPELISVTLDWGGKVLQEKVPWFQYENDPQKNSNVYEVANSVVQKHFPGIFGIERLNQKVVDQLLDQTKKKEDMVQKSAEQEETPASESSPHKIIIPGYKIVHKEELTMSDAERLLKQRIEANAPLQQRKASDKELAASSSGKVGPRRSASKSSLTSPKSSPKMDRDGQVTPPQPSPSLPRPPSALLRMIRVASSEGHQLTLPLDSVRTFDELRTTLAQKLGIAKERQRILHGFPPRELLPPTPEHELDPLPFQPGDKVTVEVLPLAAPPQQDFHSASIPDVDDEWQPSTCGRQVDEMSSSTESGHSTLLSRLQDLQNSNVENLDAAITSLVLSATLSGQNLWTYIQGMPHLFAAGGLFHAQVERDVGLVDGKHCCLPFLPDKIFRYNQKDNRLELCLDPYGHFPIEKGIEDRVLAQAKKAKHPEETSGAAGMATSASSSMTASQLAGTSGVVLSKSTQILTAHRPFQGQGYVLSGHPPSPSAASKMADSESDESEEQMEACSSLAAAFIRHKAPAPIKPKRIASLTRKGPGVSVLNPDVSNLTNRSVEQLHSLAEAIEGMSAQVAGATVDVSTDVMMHEDSTSSDVATESLAAQQIAGIDGAPPDLVCHIVRNNRPEPDTRPESKSSMNTNEKRDFVMDIPPTTRVEQEVTPAEDPMDTQTDG